jgi:hypothetical protein
VRTINLFCAECAKAWDHSLMDGPPHPDGGRYSPRNMAGIDALRCPQCPTVVVADDAPFPDQLLQRCHCDRCNHLHREMDQLQGLRP